MFIFWFIKTFFYKSLIIFENHLELLIDEYRQKTVQILNKLCTLSPEGHEKTLEIFDYYKVYNNLFVSNLNPKQFLILKLKRASNQSSRFKCITQSLHLLCKNTFPSRDEMSSNYYVDLDFASKEVYVCDLLKLINNLIKETKAIPDRMRIRYEFINMKLIELFKAIM